MVLGCQLGLNHTVTKLPFANTVIVMSSYRLGFFPALKTRSHYWLLLTTVFMHTHKVFFFNIM